MVTKAELESQLAECRGKYAASVLDQTLAERQYKLAMASRDAYARTLEFIRTAMIVTLETKYPDVYPAVDHPTTEEELLLRMTLRRCNTALENGDD